MSTMGTCSSHVHQEAASCVLYMMRDQSCTQDRQKEW